MADDQTKLKEIERKLGLALLDKGIFLLQDSFSGLENAQLTADMVRGYVLNLGLNIPINQFDYKYYTTSWQNWQLLISSVILDKALYLADKRDCDNYAYLFASLSTFLMSLNTCGVAFGEIYDKTFGRFIDRHYFNTILTSDGSLYLIDSLNSYPDYVKIEKDKDIVLGNWKYKLLSITFF